MNRRDQGKAETRAALVRTAFALFAEHGVEGTTTREVARAAGVGVGTVFAHFPDKAALVEAVLVERLDAALRRGFDTLPEGALVDRLVHLASELYATYAEHPAISRALVANALFLTGDRPTSAQLAAFRDRCIALGMSDEDFVGFFALYFAILVGGLRGDFPLAAQPALLHHALSRWLGRTA